MFIRFSLPHAVFPKLVPLVVDEIFVLELVPLLVAVDLLGDKNLNPDSLGEIDFADVELLLPLESCLVQNWTVLCRPINQVPKVGVQKTN